MCGIPDIAHEPPEMLPPTTKVAPETAPTHKHKALTTRDCGKYRSPPLKVTPDMVPEPVADSEAAETAPADSVPHVRAPPT